MNDQKALVEKAKRRVKRFVKTGENQARVFKTQKENVFGYTVKHHSKIIYFRMDKLGRLTLLRN